MGGDYAPGVVVEGALAALAEFANGNTLVLYGNPESIKAHPQAAELLASPRVELVATTETIEMGDHPAKAFAAKTDSSITVAFGHLKAGKIDALASAGNTGAMMVGCMMAVGQIEGVIRPAIATAFTAATGKPVLLLDAGLNADCKPEVLVQYGTLGSIYAQNACGVSNPRVALLNIGEEPEKGNLVAKATHPLMAEAGARGEYNFVGNIEGKSLLSGTVADVVVCDGFMGNTLLKTLEGFFDVVVAKNSGGNPVIDSLNYENVGGTPVLGINSTVIIGHGRSSAKAVKNMILAAERTATADLTPKFRKAFSHNG